MCKSNEFYQDCGRRTGNIRRLARFQQLQVNLKPVLLIISALIGAVLLTAGRHACPALKDTICYSDQLLPGTGLYLLLCQLCILL